MDVRIERLVWEGRWVDHLRYDKHIEPFEVEEICYEERHRGLAVRHGNRVFVYGRTVDGRYLTLVLERMAPSAYRPRTGWEMSRQEIRRYQRAVGER